MFGVGVDVAENPALALGDGLVAKLLDGNFVAPLAECAFSELLNIALVHQGDGLAAGLERVADGIPDQPLGPEDRDRLDADARIGANFFLAALQQIVVDELDQPRRIGAALFELDARVHVFGVLAEDDDVDLLGMLHRAGHALVILHRAHAGVEIEQLAQRNVERADAAADGRGQRSLDGDAQVAGGAHRVVGQPGVELAKGFFAGENLEPLDPRLPP